MFDIRIAHFFQHFFFCFLTNIIANKWMLLIRSSVLNSTDFNPPVSRCPGLFQMSPSFLIFPHAFFVRNRSPPFYFRISSSHKMLLSPPTTLKVSFRCNWGSWIVLKFDISHSVNVKLAWVKSHLIKKFGLQKCFKCHMWHYGSHNYILNLLLYALLLLM